MSQKFSAVLYSFTYAVDVWHLHIWLVAGSLECWILKQGNLQIILESKFGSKHKVKGLAVAAS